MKGFKKAQKDLKNDMLVLFILELLFFVFSIFSSSISLTFTSVIFAILLFVGYNYAKKGEKKSRHYRNGCWYFNDAYYNKCRYIGLFTRFICSITFIKIQ
ncbi:unknown [Clostridium sp. CAG:1000]|jgi:hypothetical protein|nr:unknown [Clostridium sp. CAG:1000]